VKASERWYRLGPARRLGRADGRRDPLAEPMSELSDLAAKFDHLGRPDIAEAIRELARVVALLEASFAGTK